MRIFSYLFVAVIVFLGITFASLNATPVVFNYYLNTKTFALSMLLVVAFGIGTLFGFIFILFSLLRLQFENSRLKSRLKISEQEVANLRSLPIKGE